MKKLFVLLLMAVTVYSCKKDYTCACTQVYYEPPTQTDPAYISTTSFANTIHEKEDQARAYCEANNSVSNGPTGQPGVLSTTTVTCELQ